MKKRDKPFKRKMPNECSQVRKRQLESAQYLDYQGTNKWSQIKPHCLFDCPQTRVDQLIQN